MKKLRVLIFPIIFILAGCAHSPPIIKTLTTSNKSQGFYPTGELRYDYRFSNGVREGITKEYYKTGERKADFTYNSDVLVDGNGFFETGELQYKYQYKNGVRNGFTDEYNKDGSIKAKWFYKDGKLQ